MKKKKRDFSEEFVNLVKDASVDAVAVLRSVAKTPCQGDEVCVDASNAILEQYRNCVEQAAQTEMIARINALETKTDLLYRALNLLLSAVKK